MKRKRILRVIASSDKNIKINKKVKTLIPTLKNNKKNE